MAISIITNRAWADRAVFKVTNGSDVETADTGTLSMVGGPRHLSFTQAGTAGLRFAYINKTNKLTADTLVMVNASRHVGHAFQIVYWTTYTSSMTQIFTTTNWAPTLVNNSRDFISTGLGISNAEAVGIVLDSGTGGAYTKTLNQIYFGTAFALPTRGNVIIEPVWTAVTVGRQRYLVDERRTIEVPHLTRTQVETLQMLPNLMTEPCFVYDSDGYVFADTLYHCICTQVAVTARFDNFHDVSLELYRLRRYE